MANSNTKRKRRSQDRAINQGYGVKRGHAVDSENEGRFQPRLTPAMEKQAEAIRRQTRKLYGEG